MIFYRYLKFSFLLLVIMLSGCSVFLKSRSTSTMTSVFQPPPGIDSLVAVKADSLADLFFVDYNEKFQANRNHERSKQLYIICDSLWILYHSRTNSDALHSAENKKLLMMYYHKGYQILENTKAKYKKQYPDKRDVINLASMLGLRAKDFAEKAKSQNPFDLKIRLTLIQIYMLLAKIEDNNKYYKWAIKEIEEFLKSERSYDNIYTLLAECLYALSKWSDAYQNFCKAQKILEQTALFQDNSSVIDTTKLVYLLQQQADTKAKMYDDSTALVLLQKARLSAKTTQKQQQIDNYIKWINWDDGNILAVEKRDAILELYQQNKFKKANKEFKKLLRILKTQRTKDIINWKIATIDFKILNKKEEGVERLFQVVKDIPVTNLKDSSSTIYLTDYGAMCYSLGVEYLYKKKYKIAYTYFTQAAKISWPDQGKCYFQLAKLSQVSPYETIKNCQKALTFYDQLTHDIIKEIYKLLINEYKSSGNFALAQEFYRKLN